MNAIRWAAFSASAKFAKKLNRPSVRLWRLGESISNTRAPAINDLASPLRKISLSPKAKNKGESNMISAKVRSFFAAFFPCSRVSLPVVRLAP